MASAVFVGMGRRLGLGGALSDGVLTCGQPMYWGVSSQKGGLMVVNFLIFSLTVSEGK